MHLGGAPQRVLKARSSDQVAHLLGDAGTTSRRAGPPPPIGGKALPMPAHHGLGPDNGYGIKDARAAPVEPYEQSSVGPTQMQPAVRCRLLQDVQLMPQDQDFGLQPLSRLETAAQHTKEQKADCDHSAIMF